MLVKVINLPRNVQVNSSLHELCRRHVVVLEVKVLQVVYIQPLVDNVLKFLTQPVPVWQMDLDKLEVLFFFVTLREALHHLKCCPYSRLLLIAHARFLTHFAPVWQSQTRVTEDSRFSVFP